MEQFFQVLDTGKPGNLVHVAGRAEGGKAATSPAASHLSPHLCGHEIKQTKFSSENPALRQGMRNR